MSKLPQSFTGRQGCARLPQAMVCACGILLALLASARTLDAGEPKPVALPRAVELRGRVVCLAEEMHRLHDVPLPTNHEHLWGLQASDRMLYTLLRGKYSDAIFLDERVRQKELLIKARLFPNTQLLEITNLRSIKDGVVQDLYYYCDICAIKGVSPETCACCQGPVELVEKPLKDSSE